MTVLPHPSRNDAARAEQGVSAQHVGVAAAERVGPFVGGARRSRVDPAVEQGEPERRLRLGHVGRELGPAPGGGDRAIVDVPSSGPLLI